MKKTVIKICSVLLISALIVCAAYLTGFDFGSISKVFAAQTDSSCDVYRGATYIGGGPTGTWFAYEDYTLTQGGTTIEGISITDYHGPYGDVVIPDNIDGKPVLSLCLIGDCCFKNDKQRDITSVTLPSTLKVISNNTFRGMTNLKSITIPDSVEIIGSYAFYDCPKLENVIFSEGEGKGLKSIYSNAFYRCRSLSSFDFPDTLQYIGDDAFYECTNLSSFEFPDSLKTIGAYAFYRCIAITSLEFPASLETIGSYAFYSCGAITSLDFPASLQSVGAYAYAYCKNISEVNFNEGLNLIGSYAFYNCNLQNVELKDGLQKIENNSFASNKNLKTIKLPEGLTYIGNAFISDTLIEELDLPDSLKSAGKFLDGTLIKEIVLPPNFAKLKSGMLSSNKESLESLTVQDTDVEKIGFKNLKTFIFKGKGEIAENPFYTETVTVSGVKTTTVYPPETFIFTDAINSNVHNLLIDELNYHLYTDPETGYYVYSKVFFGEDELQGNSFTSGDYIYDTTADGGAVIIDYAGTETGVLTVPGSFENEGVTYPVVAIGRNAFEGASATEINLPETVERIGIYAFYNCKNLTKTNLPEGIKVIEPYTYAACRRMSEINIPEGVVYIGDYAFSGTRPVSELVIPSSVKVIGAKAFYNNYYLTSLTLNEGLEKIGESAFENSESPYDNENILEYSLTLPSSIKEIGESAFFCSGVGGEVVIPESITKIPESLFYGCDFLTSVVMHSGITEIGKYAFSSCYNLTSATLLSGLETIREEAFAYSGLTSVTIPATVTSLGQSAFYCTDITAVTIPANIKTVPERCFSDCHELKNITITNGVEYIEDYAFAGYNSYDRIVIPPSMLGIESTAFQAVTRIENFVFNATCSESDLSYDEDNETGRFSFILNFRRVKKIGKLTIGGNVKYIPADLAYNAKIEEVVLPNNVVAIGESAFDNCTIEKSLVIPNSVKTIYESAFIGANIPEITLPETLESVKELAFYRMVTDTLYYNCKNCAFEIYPYETDIEGVYESPFGPFGLKNFVIGENVETLPDFTFCSISTLDTVHIPENIKSLSKGAFAFSGVKKVTGMAGLSKLEDYLFYQSALTTLEADNSVIDRTGKYAFAYSTIESLSGLEALTQIDDYAFYECEKFASLNAENSKINKVGKYAFANSGIESLSGLEAITQIKDYTFYECMNLKEIDLTNFKVTDIGSFAFANSGLTSFIGSNLLESVAESSFENCVNFASLDLGTKIMLIDNNAFKGCTALKELTVPDSVKNIGDRAFADCTALETVYMSVNVDYIPTECFVNDAALSSFTWNAASKLIGRLAFGNCTSLNEFDFIGIEKLYESSFYNSGVKVVSLGEALDNAAATLKEIEAQSFQNCSDLEMISIGGDVSTVSNLAFAGCPNLEVAVISDSVIEIADDAFEDCPNLNFVCSPTSYAYAYASENGIPVSTLVIAAIPNQTYTGNYIRPELTVTFSNTSLTKDIDYTVNFSNNKNVGQATVTVSGKGSYDMLVSKANFTIVTRSISKARIADIKPQRYTGSPIKPSLTITDNGRYLSEGTDYKVSYYDNVNHGTAYVFVVGKGNYSGSVQTSFTIEELGGGDDAKNWIEAFFRDFFARFISLILSLGFIIR